MYERSAIVLERYMEKILEFDKTYNLKDNYKDFENLIEEIKQYEIITTKEGKIIQEFDDTAKRIQLVQKRQTKLYNINISLEEERAKLFADLGEDSDTLEYKLKKVENNIDRNNEELKEIREQYIDCLTNFSQRQKERNKCEKTRRISEANHIEYINKSINQFASIENKMILNIKDFILVQKDAIKEEIIEIMIKNGKNEKVSFNEDVIKRAIKVRISIAEKEAECYILAYDKMKRLLAEIDNDILKIEKYEKILKNISVKLAFLEAQKEYVVGFLDYERMTSISGIRVHKKLMEEACRNFELDIIQIENLYEIILREIANKSTKKLYKELYNQTYLKNIEDKEKNFEQEINSISINMGTVINSNYWRIEGIKLVYNVFNEEVSNKFEVDLSHYIIEEQEEYKELEEAAVKTEETNKIENKHYVIEYEEYEEDEEDDDEEEYEEKIEEIEIFEEDEIEDEDYEYDEEDNEEDIEVNKESKKVGNRYKESKKEPKKEVKKDNKKNTKSPKKDSKKKSIEEDKKQQANGIFGNLFKEKTRGKRLKE